MRNCCMADTSKPSARIWSITLPTFLALTRWGLITTQVQLVSWAVWGRAHYSPKKKDSWLILDLTSLLP